MRVLEPIEPIAARPIAPAPIHLHPVPTPVASPMQRNRLLRALPADELRRWSSFLELVRLSSGQVLAGPGVAASHVYFPVDAIVSLVCLTQDGGCTEVASVGNEGVVGVSLFVGGSAGTTQSVVQCAGLAFRMKAPLLREQFNQSPTARAVLMRYLQALLMQSAQMTVCNRHHTVDQQLSRWILLALDRSDSMQLQLTQEMIANALGVRRAGVTEAASKLRKAGLLRCSRGRITVLDRARLEHHACECYDVIRQELGRVTSVQPTEIGDFRFARVEPVATRAVEPANESLIASHVVAKQLGAQELRPAVNGLPYCNGNTR